MSNKICNSTQIIPIWDIYYLLNISGFLIIRICMNKDKGIKYYYPLPIPLFLSYFNTILVFKCIFPYFAISLPYFFIYRNVP